MKKSGVLFIMLLISLSLFGITACQSDSTNSYEQITPEQAKTATAPPILFGKQ